MKNLPKIKISFGKIFFYFYVFMFVLGFLALLFISLFLYKNFYQVIAQSQEVVVLRREVAPEDINIKTFEAIINNIKKKEEKKEIEHLPNF